MSGRRSRNVARTEGAFAPIPSSPKRRGKEDQRRVQARRISISVLGSYRAIGVKRRVAGFAQLYDWLNQRDLLILKADRQGPLVVGLSLAAKIAKGTAA